MSEAYLKERMEKENLLNIVTKQRIRLTLREDLQ